MITKSTDNPRHLVAEASDIGFAAGVWPTSFTYNGVKFFRASAFYVGRGSDRELGGYEYRTLETVEGDSPTGMTVFND